MKIKLVSHASVIVETADTAILIDPWLLGKAFNDSWALSFEPVLKESDLEKIDFLWISHEHPDHLHFASLKSLPEAFRARVTVLFQKRPSKNVVNSLRGIARFKNIIELPHRERIDITRQTSVYCYHSRQIDSALAVMSEGQSVIDLNDVLPSKRDRKILAKDLGSTDCVLNQFSIAGYGGDHDHEKVIPPINQKIIENMVDDSAALKAKVTVPFASFIYFCCEDNRYLNAYANRPQQVLERFEAAGMNLKLLAPGESYSLGAAVDNTEAAQFYQRLYADNDSLEIEKSDPVPLDNIRKAFVARTNQLLRNHSQLVLRLIKPMVIRIPDLDRVVRIKIADQSFAELSSYAEYDLKINSQPLWYAFKYPWGIQTLGVSARLCLYSNAKQWRRLRYLMALNSVDVHLRFSYLLSPAFAYFLRERRAGLFSQVIDRLRYARSGY